MTGSRRIAWLALTVVPLSAGCPGPREDEATGQDTLLVVREVRPAERRELQTGLQERFGQQAPAGAEYRAMGPFRFVSTADFNYLDRRDVGSVVFERSRYGVSDASLDSTSPPVESLLKRIDAGLARTRLDTKGRRFVGFRNEFAGAVQPKGLSLDFDPRKEGRLVARTAAFERFVDSIPVFGSELLVGLLPDGSIGRFRLHWPRIDDSVVKQAATLRSAVEQRSWTLPDSIRAKGIEVIGVSAGVGHSGIADPRFRARAVVRVLYRKVEQARERPLVSTAYKYFDVRGTELQLDTFPEPPATRVGDKRPDDKR